MPAALIDVRFCLDNVDQLLAPSPPTSRKLLAAIPANMPSPLQTRAQFSQRNQSMSMNKFIFPENTDDLQDSGSRPEPNQDGRDPCATFPAEILLRILSFLDGTSLLRCESVSKRYCKE